MSLLASYSKKYVQKVKVLSPQVYPFSKMVVKWRDLTWPRKSPKFNLHHLRKISTEFKMAMLTSKSGIVLCALEGERYPTLLMLKFVKNGCI